MLSDEKAKTLYDVKIRVEMEKKKRDSMLDAQRKAMRDSLLARESEAKRHRMKEDEVEDVQAKFQAEVNSTSRLQDMHAPPFSFL